MGESLEQIFKGASSQNSTTALSGLLRYGREKGFGNFLNRKLIWPFLLGVDTDQLGSSIYEWEGALDRNSPDYEQLQKDAERALGNMKTFDNITKFHLQKKQRDVLKTLDSFFGRHRDLRYIQGFHDVASIFLILFGNNTGYYLMERAGKTYFRDCLTKDIGPLTTTVSQLLLQLLLRSDPQLREVFECFAEMGMLMFVVPWILTWFSHVFSSAKIICRIWDYLLCTGPHGIVYLTAGVILATKDDLLKECSQYDPASIHTFYQETMKKQAVDIEKAIAHAIRLQEHHSLPSLTAFANFQSDSVFIGENFERWIDIHRRVREYNNKVQQDRSKMIKGALVAASALAVGTLLYLRFGKKIK